MKASEARSYPHPVNEDANEVPETLRGDAAAMCVRLSELADRVERVHDALHGPVPRKDHPGVPEPVPAVRFIINKACSHIQRIEREIGAIERRL